MVYRVYAEKKAPYAVEAKALLEELRNLLGIGGLDGLRILNRYDVEGVDEALFRRCVPVVFSEPAVDEVYDHLPQGDCAVFAVEYLPGQFDQRAASASECVQLISAGERPAVRSAKVYLLSGALSAEDVERVKRYVINPVEAREAALDRPDTLAARYDAPETVAVLESFNALDAAGLAKLGEEMGLAMDGADMAFCQGYFQKEGRDPTVTEVRVLDTYWSDHCRHTTFGTILDEVTVEEPAVKEAWDLYLRLRAETSRDKKPICLMDLATIGAKYLKQKGILKNLDESDEINACSVRIQVDNGGKMEDWLLLFKNETHNHPTEIEPFGGAATCIGGAIRDPLANRGYVFSAMRVTGAGDPLVPVEATLAGKLPQRKLVTTAAQGYSSYGNQIGLATGQVTELYHPGYVAKRMEIGAVMGAVPEANVRREEPTPGDVVILLGGRTGRDGCGGATGSSKAHKLESLESCGAEVQKGNAPEERKLQRLFRNPAATRLIKRCNDFGAGGVSVAVGELADGLIIDLDTVPKKYEGLDGTELAISESQERMAVVVEAQEADAFIALAHGENLEATVVAVVTEAPRMVMKWKGNTVCDIARNFLASNGAEKHAKAVISAPRAVMEDHSAAPLSERLGALVTDLNICSQQGLAQRFDSTIGAATVLMPFGGKYQKTPAQVMSHKLPVAGETATCAGMAFGFDPFVSERDEFRGAWLAVCESVAKLTAAGFQREKMYLTFQEYFKRLGADPERWGNPLAALLGALKAQLDLGVAAIGGKDSMSGTFEHIDVPPTLVSFAVASGAAGNVISPEFKAPGHRVVLLTPEYDGFLPMPESFNALCAKLEGLISEKQVLSAWAVVHGGVAEGLFKMCLGNRVGFAGSVDGDTIFAVRRGAFLLELAEEAEDVGLLLGRTVEEYAFTLSGERVDLAELERAYEAKLAPVFPLTAAGEGAAPTLSSGAKAPAAPGLHIARPRVLIPVFPGTNCEYDSARAMERAGAVPQVLVVNNLTPARVEESVSALAKAVRENQMVFLPGGFSGGDEPEGSAKLIAALFRAPALAEAVTDLLERRDGLMLGVCNGFQALVKLGLVPFGRIQDMTGDSPTLTFNTIGRHQSMLVRTRVSSVKSPWLAGAKVGEVYTVPISHGEGRFVAPEATLKALAENGQIAAQYVDLAGEATMDGLYNPNGSYWAIEAVTSPDGRVLGKMGHSERMGEELYKNVPGRFDMGIFRSGAAYFQ
ncbi:phosphoribosylformylglycinamidine synthase [Pseudoflavonifractor phocaeensis]|uniref:phosphoribosylformylglycinamidine synthase n=1 Tax=Pseudoflavonifractor phocaeensis TaxID=1870988 RepID=UPI00313C905F